MSFLNLVFLLGIAAVAIPIWLHLSKKRVFQEMPLGSLRFLKPAVKQRKKKARFEEIPLLLLRALALVLLAFTFARPLLPNLISGERDEPIEETIILLDASGSITPEMEEEAREAAEDAMADSGGSSLTLAQFSDKVEVIASLDDYAPRPGAETRLIDSMEWVLDRFLASERKVSKVILIGHLHPDSLPTTPPRVWPPGAKVELVSLTPPKEVNAAVTGTELLTPFQTKEMLLEATVRIPSSAKSRQVTLEAEGLRLVKNLPPGARRLSFNFRPPRDVVRGWVSVQSDDPWPADNRRPFVVKWSKPQRVLLVDGRPGSTPFEGQAYFIQKALEASGSDHGISPFQPEIAYGLEGREGLRDVSEYKAIALCGVTDLSSSAARALASFVDQGGGLVSFLDETSPESYNEASLSDLLPSSITMEAGADLSTLEKWQKDHPIFAGFDTPAGGSLDSFRWRNQLVLDPGSDWNVLASFPLGTPLILASKKHERVLVCAHPMTREWSELPRNPLFVPLMKNFFAHLTGYVAESSEISPVTPGIDESRKPGIYSQNAITALVASDPSESTIGTVSDEKFRNSFGLPDEKSSLPPALPAKNTPRLSARPNELWPWVLLVLLAVLVTENFLSTRPLDSTVPSS